MSAAGWSRTVPPDRVEILASRARRNLEEALANLGRAADAGDEDALRIAKALTQSALKQLEGRKSPRPRFSARSFGREST